MKYKKKLITTGSSVTAGSSDIPTAIAEKSTWVHNLIEPWNIEILVNLAISGGGNIASSFNLKWFVMNHNEFTSDNTLILLNLIDLDRYDLLVDADHPDANEHCSWSTYCGFGWLTSGGFHNNRKWCSQIQMHSGYNNFVKMNQMAIIDLITFIESRGFEYAFMCYNNDILTKNMNTFFWEFISKRNSKLITFENHHMHEYCKVNYLLSDDGEHPSKEGYAAIAKYVINHFNKG